MPTWQVAAPLLNTAAGTYATELNVSATTQTGGATLRYSVDGTEPTSASPVFPASLAVTQSSTVKVKAFKSGYVASRTLAAAYTLEAAAPAMSHSSGTYGTDVNVTLSSATSNAQIRYTVDGSEPTASSPLYSTPVAITAGTS